METSMAEVRIKDIDEHEIDTILAEDIDFEGHLTFKKPLMIKGKFKGEIKSTSSLYIGEKAYVEATTEADVVSSKGRHKGDILGHSRVELFSTARVDGDITTPDFVMESGCKFNGNCNMGGEPARKEGSTTATAGGATPATGNASEQQPRAPEQQSRSPEQPPRPQGQQQRAPDAFRNVDVHRAPSPQQPQQQRPPFPSGGGGQVGGSGQK
jgi:cytoskeletal protein CcmA (bactofilin family)